MGTKRVGLARTQVLIENLKRELTMNLSTIYNSKRKIIDSAATRELLASESGATVLWDNSTPHTVTLPAAEAGLNFKIVVKVGSNTNHKIAAAAGDCFFGQVTVLDNADDKQAQQTVTYATAIGTVGSYDHLLLKANSNNTGSGAGAVIELECIDSIAWRVTARLVTTATPTSIATIYGG
tara:strand:- start:47940 stop:48479 length:540 start_codon:yes stop_codon:yes gene_type:complete